MELINSPYYGSANLKAYYRFSTGALTTDSSPSGYTLTAIGTPTEDASGKFDGSVAFGGAAAYSRADHADWKPTGVFSVGGWLKTSTAGTTKTIFQSYSANTAIAGIYLSVRSLNTIQFASGRNTGTVAGTNYQVINGTTTITDGVWHFIVGVWDGSYLRLYVDGVEDSAAVAWANAPAYAATNYVRVGCGNASGTNITFLTGSLDDQFLLNGADLSLGQIQELYNDGGPKVFFMI